MAKHKYNPSPSVPLKFHKAWNYVLLPLIFAFTLYMFIRVLMGADRASGDMIFSVVINLSPEAEGFSTGSMIATSVFYAILLVLQALTFVGMLKWKRWSYGTNKAHIIIWIVIWSIVLIASIVGTVSMGVLSTSDYYSSYGMYMMGGITTVFVFLLIASIVLIVLNVLVLKYYGKRVLLFKGSPNQADVLAGAVAPTAAMWSAGQGYAGQYGQQGSAYPQAQHSYDSVQGQYGAAGYQGGHQVPEQQGFRAQVPVQAPVQESDAGAAEPARAARLFCGKCGAKLPIADAKFCTKCGARLG